MLITSIIIFAVAAIFGIINLVAILNSKTTNKAVVFIHGGLAALALILIILFALSSAGSAGNSLIISIVLFVIAALGGFVLFARDLLKKPGPKALAVIHGLAAVIGFVILLIFAFA